MNQNIALSVDVVKVDSTDIRIKSNNIYNQNSQQVKGVSVSAYDHWDFVIVFGFVVVIFLAIVYRIIRLIFQKTEKNMLSIKRV